MRKNLIFVFCGLLLGEGLVMAAPDSIRFQGRLTDSSGSPIVGNDVRVKFALFNTVSGGTAVWEGPRPQIVATNEAGLFATDMGPMAPHLFANYADLFLEISVHDGTAYKSLTPRQKLMSVPYSFYSENAEQATYATFVPDKSITGLKIQENAIRSNHLQNEIISSVKLSSNAVTSAKILDGSVENEDLASNSVGSDQIMNEAVDNHHVKSGSLSRDRLDTFSFEGAGPGLIPPGGILMFLTSCPAGFTEVTALRNRFPIGADPVSQDPQVPDSPNQIMGYKTHSHNLTNPLDFDHRQIISTGDEWVFFNQPKLVYGLAAGGGGDVPYLEGRDHKHLTSDTIHLPPGLTVAFCQKN